jgi:hypothetical protein
VARATRRRRKPPWGNLLGKPIKRGDEALAEQGQKMLKLLAHYGIEERRGAQPWYDLALSICREIDPALDVIDRKPRGKTGEWAKGQHGAQLVMEVEARRAAISADGGKPKTLAILAEIFEWAPQRFAHIKAKNRLAAIEARYYDALNYWRPKATKRARKAA